MSMYYLNPKTGKYELQGAPHVDAYSKEQTDALIGAVATEAEEYPGCFYRMVNDVQEWLNPPMALGVEYRTTERHLGKPVYVRILDCGAGPNKSITYTAIPNGDVCKPFECYTYGEGGLVNPMGGNNITTDFTYGGAYEGNVRICSTANVSHIRYYAKIKYTKTTD